MARVAENKAVEVNDLKEIWTKNRDKKVFLKYVRDKVAAYQKPASQTVLKPEPGTSVPRAK